MVESEFDTGHLEAIEARFAIPTDKARTSKPCPACGRKALRDPSRPCPTCERFILAAVRRWTEQGKDRKTVAVAVSAQPYRMKQLPGRSKTFSKGDTPAEAFLRTLSALALAVSEASGEEPEWWGGPWITPMSEGHGRAVWSGDAVVLMRKEAADLFQKLFAAALAMAEDAYEDGKEDGRNLLLGLAKGEVNVEEFNERGARKGRR